MYRNINTEKLDSILYMKNESDLNNDEKLTLFNRATNLLKLKAKLNSDHMYAIIHQDDYYSYVHLSYNRPAFTINTLFGSSLVDKLEHRVNKKYGDEITNSTFMIAIPNDIIKYLMFEKLRNKVEVVKREYSYNNELDTSHCFKDSEKSYMFFEALLREGIESRIYLYCSTYNWFTTMLEYTKNNKMCIFNKRVEKCFVPYAEKKNASYNIESDLITLIHGNDLKKRDGALLYMCKYGLDDYGFYRDLYNRTLLAYKNSYDLFSDARHMVISCME